MLPALMIYDCCLSVEDELTFVWRRKMSPSSWLFLANRLALIFAALEFGVGSASTAVGARQSIVSASVLTEDGRREGSTRESKDECAPDVYYRCTNSWALSIANNVLPLLVNIGELIADRVHMIHSRAPSFLCIACLRGIR